LTGCTGIPEGIKVVDGFEINRYLGIWYEIARLDHRFERGFAYSMLTEPAGLNV
jgi:apolipoprotein D and lipocalin family protein